MSLVIRTATQEDVHVIGKIHMQSMRMGFQDIVPDDFWQKVSEESIAQKYADYSSKDDIIVLVAEQRGELLGFACAGSNRGEAEGYDMELYALYVSPDAIGKGVGSTLLQGILHHCAQAGRKKLILWCFSANKGAIHCYSRNGGTKLDYPPPQEYLDLPHTAFGWDLGG